MLPEMPRSLSLTMQNIRFVADVEAVTPGSALFRGMVLNKKKH